jgi:type IV secretory pathway VirB3-like protein
MYISVQAYVWPGCVVLAISASALWLVLLGVSIHLMWTILVLHDETTPQEALSGATSAPSSARLAWTAQSDPSNR